MSVPPAAPAVSPSPSSNPRSQELVALLSRTALGDRAAFATLYQRTSAHLLGVVVRINSDRAQAEDVLQEVYVKVWNAAGSFNAGLAQPMTWLTSIARNRAIDSLRRRQTEAVWVTTRHAADDEQEDMLDHLASDDPGPLDLLGQAASARAVKVCLQSLNGEQQQSIALAFYQGLSHAEVAAHMKQPLGSVKSWVRRGLLALRACLERGAQPPAAPAARS
jgi:RNA polymerase sigma-70 factor (ECF subfamily)